ncbi:helix-turn-helix domain-containing protein [Haladaptatus sp. NG-WS-4]
MSTSERDERGRFSAKHTDDEVVAAVRKHEPAATSEVADELEIKRPSADYRLRQLQEEGTVTSKKIGTSLAWSLTPETEP